MSTRVESSPEADVSVSPETAAVHPRPTWWVKLIAFAACLLTLWHISASFLWIAPYSALREIPTQEVLAVCVRQARRG